MDNPAIEQVFQNDYVMAHILRMLDLKQQYELQKICERLRFLVTTCVWRRYYKEIQMNRNQAGKLTDEDFFQMLRLNADNIQKLTIDAVNGAALQLHFPVCYENLLELHIKRFKLEDNVLAIIASNCPQLQLLDYNEDRNLHYEAENTLQSLAMLWTLSNLRVVILKNLVKPISCSDLYLLATKVPLERLEFYNITVSGSGWDSEDSSSLVPPDLKVFKSNYKHIPRHKCMELIEKCRNLQELQLIHHSSHEFNEDFFAKFRHLERLKLESYITIPTALCIIRNTKLKFLEMVVFGYVGPNFQIAEDGQGICGSLQNLKVVNTLSGGTDFWSDIFQLPFANFENLQELTFKNEVVHDEFMKSISRKCQALKSLHLCNCKISGKYINHLTNLHRLTIMENNMSIPWRNFYPVLRDLQLLQYLEIDCISLLTDYVDIPPNVKNVAKSLEILKIYQPETDTNIWEHILEHCEGSFHKVHTVHLSDFGMDDYYNNVYFTIFKQLHTVQLVRGSYICPEDFVSERVLVSPVKHLILNECYELNWSDIVAILKCTKLEKFEIFNVTLEQCDFNSHPMQDYVDNLEHIRKITIPYEIFKNTLPFYRRCLEHASTFQLCCTDHWDHTEVLRWLFENSPAKERIKAIHANKDLNSIKSYCAETMGDSNIPVYLLDADNKEMWNVAFADSTHVLLIEI